MSAETTSGTNAVKHVEKIYVALLGEGLDVWRPVDAERVSGDTYRILDQGYDRDVETWEFEPGALVRCRRERRGGDPVLVATEAVADPAAQARAAR